MTNHEDDKEINRTKSDASPVKVKVRPTVGPGQQAKENRKRHRKNDTTPPPELGQNLNA
jgi:hypothetical protein